MLVFPILIDALPKFGNVLYAVLSTMFVSYKHLKNE
jgi:hypothetical protein